MSFTFNAVRLKIPIFYAGLLNLFTQLLVTTYNSYIVLYLEKDLLTGVIIITIIVSLQNILQLFFRVPLSELSQIIGRRPLIIFGNFCYLIAIIFLFLAPNYSFVLVSSFLIALGMSAYWPALFAYIGDVANNNYGELLGRIFLMGDFGALFGAYFAYLLLDVFLLDLRQLFGYILLIECFSVFLSILIIPEVLDKSHKLQVASLSKAVYQSFIRMMHTVWQLSLRPELQLVYDFQFLISFAEFIFVAFFSVIVVNHGFSKGQVGEIIFWGTLLLLWFKPSLGKVSDKLGYRIPVTIILFFISFAFISIIYMYNIVLFIIAFIIVMAGIFTSYQALSGATSKIASVKQRGVAMGVLGFYISLGRGISTLLLGLIWEIFSLQDVFLFSAIGIIFLAVILFYKSKSPQVVTVV